MNELFGLIVLLLAALLGPDVHAATAANAYFTVSCSTYGVEDLVPIGPTPLSLLLPLASTPPVRRPRQRPLPNQRGGGADLIAAVGI